MAVEALRVNNPESVRFDVPKLQALRNELKGINRRIKGLRGASDENDHNAQVEMFKARINEVVPEDKKALLDHNPDQGQRAEISAIAGKVANTVVQIKPDIAVLDEGLSGMADQARRNVLNALGEAVGFDIAIGERDGWTITTALALQDAGVSITEPGEGKPIRVNKDGSFEVIPETERINPADRKGPIKLVREDNSVPITAVPVEESMEGQITVGEQIEEDLQRVREQVAAEADRIDPSFERFERDFARAALESDEAGEDFVSLEGDSVTRTLKKIDQSIQRRAFATKVVGRVMFHGEEAQKEGVNANNRADYLFYPVGAKFPDPTSQLLSLNEVMRNATLSPNRQPEFARKLSEAHVFGYYKDPKQPNFTRLSMIYPVEGQDSVGRAYLTLIVAVTLPTSRWDQLKGIINSDPSRAEEFYQIAAEGLDGSVQRKPSSQLALIDLEEFMPLSRFPVKDGILQQQVSYRTERLNPNVITYLDTASQSKALAIGREESEQVEVDKRKSGLEEEAGVVRDKEPVLGEFLDTLSDNTKLVVAEDVFDRLIKLEEDGDKEGLKKYAANIRALKLDKPIVELKDLIDDILEEE